MHLRDVPGIVWKQGKQEKCNVCNKKCTMVCIDCTHGPNSLWPCHPPTTKYRGQIKKHDCQEWHRLNPLLTPRGRRPCKRAGNSKRSRSDREQEEPEEVEEEGEEEGEEVEEEGEEDDDEL